MANRKEKFAREINRIAREYELNVIEALGYYCDEMDVDMEDIIPLLDNMMKERVRVAAIENRYVIGHKMAQLPI